MSLIPPDPRRWWALALIALAQFLVIMDTSIIGVALPAIQRAVNFSPSGLSWVFNAYVVALGGLLLLGGRLADLYGARRVFLGGFAALAAASALAAAAATPGVLIGARALQGLGAALIAPAALTLLMALFGHEPRELGRALALYGAAAPAGGTAGVFLGGVLAQWLDWRWVFLINVPVALLVLAAGPALLPAGAARRGTLDAGGALSATGALSLAVFAVVRAPEIGWADPWTLLPLVAAAGLLSLFVGLQAALREPLVPLRIFRAPNLAAANLAMALLGAAWIPMWFFLNLYLQQALRFGPFAAGAALVPMTAAMMALMVAVTPRLVGRLGVKPPIVAGLAILACGMALLGRARPDGDFVADVLPATLVAAAGMALAYIPAMMAALAGARPEEGGLASGIVNTTYQIGSALGLAALTAVAAAWGAGQAGDTTALVAGFRAAFTGAAGIALVAAALAAVALRRPAIVATEATGAPAAQPGD